MMKIFAILALFAVLAPVWSSANVQSGESLEKSSGRTSGTRQRRSQPARDFDSEMLSDGFTNFSGWSSWSEWSMCSRSCDGGASSRKRKCLFKNGCRYGENSRYRICNMQPCGDTEDFRDAQCSVYNKKLYNGQFHDWKAAPHNSQRPCALYCVSQRTSVVVEFASQVQDGTRCRTGSLDMCIGGSCMPIGCDLQLDSTKKVDECGVCGGDGSSCHQSSYHWHERGLTQCSASCGGGLQISTPVCKNRITGVKVDDWYCDLSSRPRPIVHECNTVPCPSVWKTESWSECSSSCSGGTQWRAVYCVEGRENGTEVRVDNKQCPSQRPTSERACNLVECPKWKEGPWSPCSVSCGSGYRSRPVYCRDADGRQSQACDISQKPANRQRCVLTHICSPSANRKLESTDRKATDNLPKPQQQNSASNKPRFVLGKWSDCSTTCGWGFRQRQVKCKVYVEFSGEVILSDDDCSESVKPMSKDKCFLRPCDNFISNNLDESNMVGSDEDEKYRKAVGQGHTWRTSGFTPCSASCLGGVRESITECIRTKDDAVVSPTNCDLSTKPDQLIQTCNNRPCPPRWNISDFSPCTKNCGGGKQFRTVHCIHEVTRGNVLSVANRLCPQPPPRLERLCGVISCPIKWITGKWSQCSKSCGGGVKTRTVKCQRTLAYGQVVDQPSSRCRRRKPRTVKSCKTRSCPSSSKSKPSSPRIFSNPKQVFVQKAFKKKETLKVGGKATVFKGVNLKLKCRVKGRFNRTKLIWIKDSDFVKYSKRISISRNGALRIKSMSYSDSGFYMCKAHKAQANMTIIVKPKPETFHYNSIEDDGDKDEDAGNRNRRRQRTKKNRKNRRRKKQKPYDANTYKQPSKTNQIDYSHEDNNDNDRRHKTKYAGGSGSVKQRRNRRPAVIHYEQSLSSMELLRGSRDPAFSNQKDKSQSAEEVNGFDTWEIQHGDSGSRGASVSDVKSPALFEESHEMYAPRETRPKVDLDGKEKAVVASEVPPVIYGKVQTDPVKTKPKSKKRWKTRMYATTPIGHRLSSVEENSHEELLSQKDQSSETVEKDNEKAEFRWEVGEWTKCSVECGGSGYQIRSSQCFVKVNQNISKNVDKKLCAADSKLTTPVTVRQCGQEECPQWHTANWSQCSRSRCVALNTAMMRRKIYCRLRSGTEVSRSKCNKKTKPRQKRECYNVKCKASWKVGKWSECPSRECRKGMGKTKKEEKVVERRRILECVWYGTNKPAGNACTHLVRPSVSKPCTYRKNDCKSVSRQNYNPGNRKKDCVDKTRYCIVAKSLDICRMHYYATMCCFSCSRFFPSP